MKFLDNGNKDLMTAKYSVLLPARNGYPYIKSAIETVISQNYLDYELIISNDHSVDGTSEYLASIYHPSLKILSPPQGLSMTEHWEWLLSKASGEWIIFLGQDDGLQSYFFEVSDILTKIAKRKNLRAIMSNRALYFWPGCQDFYGDQIIYYSAVAKVKQFNSCTQSLWALMGIITYFDLPQMYSNSLFHRSLIEQARAIQNGKVFVTHPQDANLAAIACSLDKRYLQSEMPLGWVGSSPKSAGMAVGQLNESYANNDLRKEYLNKIASSRLDYHPIVGSFTLNSPILYWYGAILKTQRLRSERFNSFLSSKLFGTLVFASALIDFSKDKSQFKIKRKQDLIDQIKLNDYNFLLVIFFCFILNCLLFIVMVQRSLKYRLSTLLRSDKKFRLQVKDSLNNTNLTTAFNLVKNNSNVQKIISGLRSISK